MIQIESEEFLADRVIENMKMWRLLADTLKKKLILLAIVATITLLTASTAGCQRSSLTQSSSLTITTEIEQQFANQRWGLQTPLPQDNSLEAIWGSSPSDIFAVGENGTILHCDGKSWNIMESGTTSELTDVWGSSPNDVYAAGQNGTLLHYDGIAWRSLNSHTTYNLNSVWGNSTTDVFVTGETGTILHYDGATWSMMKSGTSDSLYCVWGSSPSDVFAAGSKGRVLHYDGQSWVLCYSGTTGMTVYGIWGSSSSDVFAVGGYWTEHTSLNPECRYTDFILHSNGKEWHTLKDEKGYALYDLWGTSPKDVFAVGIYGYMVHYDGVRWSGIALFDVDSWLSGVWSSSPADVFTVGENGKILRYSGIN